MIMKRLIAFIILLMAALACQEEEKIVDPVFEFVSLRGAESVNLGEADFSEEGYPLVVQLWAFKPHKVDIEVTFEITTTNAEENVDFILSPSGSFKIPAGQ